MTTNVVERMDKIVNKPDQITEDDLRLLQTLSEGAMAEEPGEREKVVHRGDEQNPTPIIRTATKSAGYLFLRRNSDGKLVAINKNQLPERIKQRLPDGRPAWLVPNAPWEGRVKEPKYWCPLSANHKDRALMDELNLPICEKRGKLSTYAAVERHFKHKHRDSYDAYKQSIEDKKQDKRDKQIELQTQALTAALGQGAVAVGPRESTEALTQECETCKVKVTAAHRLGLASKMRAHKRKEHPDAK